MRKKNSENIPATASIRATYAPARVRLANRRSGVIGCSARRSIRRKAASRRTPPANASTVPLSPQPSVAARMKP